MKGEVITAGSASGAKCAADRVAAGSAVGKTLSALGCAGRLGSVERRTGGIDLSSSRADPAFVVEGVTILFGVGSRTSSSGSNLVVVFTSQVAPNFNITGAASCSLGLESVAGFALRTVAAVGAS